MFLCPFPPFPELSPCGQPTVAEVLGWGSVQSHKGASEILGVGAEFLVGSIAREALKSTHPAASSSEAATVQRSQDHQASSKEAFERVGDILHKVLLVGASQTGVSRRNSASSFSCECTPPFRYTPSSRSPVNSQHLSSPLPKTCYHSPSALSVTHLPHTVRGLSGVGWSDRNQPSGLAARVPTPALAFSLKVHPQPCHHTAAPFSPHHLIFK